MGKTQSLPILITGGGRRIGLALAPSHGISLIKSNR